MPFHSCNTVEYTFGLAVAIVVVVVVRFFLFAGLSGVSMCACVKRTESSGLFV